jgi:hypothetical protein
MLIPRACAEHQGRGIARDVDAGERVHLDSDAQTHEVLLKIRQMRLRHPRIGDVVWIMAGRKEDDVDPHIRAVWHETRGEQFGRHGNAGETLLVDGIDMGFGLARHLTSAKTVSPSRGRSDRPRRAGSSRGGR